jgi:hydrogenase maturation protease
MSLLDTNLVGEAQHTRAPSDPAAPILVLAVGNLLMGDEGVGIHILRELERCPPLPGTRLLDGGTGGIDLLEHIQACDTVVMIDATRDGSPAGTFKQFRATTPSGLPQGLSAHDFGLKDLFAAATILDKMPDVRLVTVSVETVRPMSMELSEPVAAAVPLVVNAVRSLVGLLATEANAA